MNNTNSISLQFLILLCFENAAPLRRRQLQWQDRTVVSKEQFLSFFFKPAFDSIVLTVNQKLVCYSASWWRNVILELKQFIFLIHLCVKIRKLPPKCPLFIHFSPHWEQVTAERQASLWHSNMGTLRTGYQVGGGGWSGDHQHQGRGPAFRGGRGTPVLQASQVALAVKNLPASAGRSKRPGFDPLVRKIPWRMTWQLTPVFLPGESHGQKSLYRPWCCRVRHDWSELARMYPFSTYCF